MRERVRPVLFDAQVGAVPRLATLASDVRRLGEHGCNAVEVCPLPEDCGAREQDVAVETTADRAGMRLTVPAVQMTEFSNGLVYPASGTLPREAGENSEGRDFRRAGRGG